MAESRSGRRRSVAPYDRGLPARKVFLHHVLDEWFETVVKPRLRGECILVRYADDALMAFDNIVDAERALSVLGKRLARYGLTLHPDKTRLVDFRPKRLQGVRHPQTDGTAFDFLGLTHVWGRSRNVRYEALDPVLDERSRQRFAAAEARAAGRGGVAAVSRITGLARSTVCSDVFNAGWSDAADKRAPGIANIRTSISTRRSASTPYRGAVPTCRARSPDDAGESRMRAICMSGLTSGDWKRSYASPD